MPDYRCPACRGGFPAAAADDDACPWCGEPMDDADDGPVTPIGTTQTVPTTGVGPLDPDTRDPFDERDLLGDHRQRRMNRAADRLDDETLRGLASTTTAPPTDVTTDRGDR